MSILIPKDERMNSIKSFFKKHIGKNNGVTKMAILNAVYGYSTIRKLKPEEHFWLWSKRIRGDINWLRKNSTCFVGVDRVDGEFHYFVIKTQADASKYCTIMSNNIIGCGKMRNKCLDYVKNKTYKAFMKE